MLPVISLKDPKPLRLLCDKDYLQRDGSVHEDRHLLLFGSGDHSLYDIFPSHL